MHILAALTLGVWLEPSQHQLFIAWAHRLYTTLVNSAVLWQLALEAAAGSQLCAYISNSSSGR